MKPSFLLSALVALLAMMFSGCSTSSITGTDNAGASQKTLAKALDQNTVTIAPLVVGKKIQMGDVEVWNDDAMLYVKINANDGWMLEKSQLAVEASPAAIPQNKKGQPLPHKFPNKRTYHPLAQSDTYALNLAWDSGTELFICLHAKVDKMKNRRHIGEESAWAAGAGYPGKTFDKYFTDIVDKSIVIVIGPAPVPGSK
jgi:hypothetical protein